MPAEAPAADASATAAGQPRREPRAGRRRGVAKALAGKPDAVTVTERDARGQTLVELTWRPATWDA